MSITDTQEHIQNLVKATYIQENHQAKNKETKTPVVTIALDHGCGGPAIAKKLGESLGVHVYDEELIRAIAKDAHVDVKLMEQLDEKVQHHKADWLLALVSGQNATVENYRHHLVNIALGISCAGGIIIGRGVHLILAERYVLRVRLVGSPDKCAERIALARNIDKDIALQEVKTINAEHGEFIWDTFKHRMNDPVSFDLTINTDRFENLDDVVGLIIATMNHTRSS